jgi:sodium-dependent dicarboxylate transporter 2/3/5
MATPVGTPANLIGLGQIEKALGLRISFFAWMAFATPLAAVLTVFLVAYLNRQCPAGPDLLGNSAEWMRAERAKLGPVSRGERNVLIAFGLTVGLWVLPGVVSVLAGVESGVARWLNQRVPESIAALLGVALLFVLPVDWKAGRFTLTWKEASQIDWGTILLFGGGLALGEAMFSTGLARWIGEGLAWGLGAQTVVGLTVVFTVVAVLLTETTSNTATAAMVVPVAIAVAQAAGVPALQPALGACLGASLAFMLPVSTPPNAIVFGSGCVPLLKMVRHGLVLDIVAIVAVVVAVCWLVPLCTTL